MDWTSLNKSLWNLISEAAALLCTRLRTESCKCLSPHQDLCRTVLHSTVELFWLACFEEATSPLVLRQQRVPETLEHFWTVVRGGWCGCLIASWRLLKHTIYWWWSTLRYSRTLLWWQLEYRSLSLPRALTIHGTASAASLECRTANQMKTWRKKCRSRWIWAWASQVKILPSNLKYQYTRRMFGRMKFGHRFWHLHGSYSEKRWKKYVVPSMVCHTI